MSFFKDCVQGSKCVEVEITVVIDNYDNQNEAENNELSDQVLILKTKMYKQKI